MEFPICEMAVALLMVGFLFAAACLLRALLDWLAGKRR